MMNKTQIALITTGFILLALMATNPSIEDHREGVKKMYKEKLAELNKGKEDELATQAGTGIGMIIGDLFIDKIVSRENYLLFSLAKVSVGDKTKNIGVGIFGQVFIHDYEKIKSEIGVDGLVNESETLLPRENTAWTGKYNNYDSRLPNYMGFGYCNPGTEDIEIKQIKNGYSVFITSKGERMDVSWNQTTEYEVSESNEKHIIFSHKNDEIGMTFTYKLYKKRDRYFVKNLTQKDCEDYEIVKTSF